jgi:sugar phosphate isomerase/epimerase
MEVACSTLCFSRQPFEHALRRIAELEFSKVDLGVAEASPHVTPQMILQDPGLVVRRIRQAPTIAFAAITARISGSADETAAKLDAICHFASQLAAPIVVVEAAPTGTPLELEANRLTNLLRTATLHGTVLTVTTKTGTVTEDPAAAVALCEAVAGLRLTLDPSHFICGPHQGKSFDQVYPYVRHLHLRDTGRRLDQLQVQVGRGDIEYGKIVASLRRFDFRGALTVAIEDTSETDLDVEAEVRKLRLLLESLL